MALHLPFTWEKPRFCFDPSPLALLPLAGSTRTLAIPSPWASPTATAGPFVAKASLTEAFGGIDLFTKRLGAKRSWEAVTACYDQGPEKKNCWSLIYENLCIHGFHIKVIRVLYSQAMRLVWLTVSGMPRRESQKMSHACPLCVVGSAHHMISSVDVIVHHFNCLYDCKNVNSYELCYSCLKKMKSI